MPITVITPSTEQPVTLQQIKHQCRIDEDDTSEDALLENVYLPAALAHAEAHTNRPIILQTLQYSGYFCKEIELTAGLNQIDSIVYIDTAGDEQTLPADQYYVDPDAVVGRVVPVTAWPAVKAGHPAPVKIRFTAGWQDAEALPASIKQAILMLIGHWVANKETVVVGTISGELPMATTMLLNPYTVNVI